MSQNDNNKRYFKVKSDRAKKKAHLAMGFKLGGVGGV